MIGAKKPELCTKILRNSEENSLPLYGSMAKIARLDDALSEIFEREVCTVEGQSLQLKIKKRKIQERPKKMILMKPPKILKILIFAHTRAKSRRMRRASGKKSMVPCFKCRFE